MIFAVKNSDRNIKENYKQVLQEFDLKIETVKCPWDEEETDELWRIQIDSLEQLLVLKEKITRDIILSDDIDIFGETFYEPTIEIYDGYRE